ncbi:MAG: hypothetical protein ACM3ZE_23345 [Myxococcales bacterium]
MLQALVRRTPASEQPELAWPTLVTRTDARGSLLETRQELAHERDGLFLRSASAARRTLPIHAVQAQALRKIRIPTVPGADMTRVSRWRAAALANSSGLPGMKIVIGRLPLAMTPTTWDLGEVGVSDRSWPPNCVTRHSPQACAHVLGTVIQRRAIPVAATAPASRRTQQGHGSYEEKPASSIRHPTNQEGSPGQTESYGRAVRSESVNERSLPTQSAQKQKPRISPGLFAGRTGLEPGAG